MVIFLLSELRKRSIESPLYSEETTNGGFLKKFLLTFETFFFRGNMFSMHSESMTLFLCCNCMTVFLCMTVWQYFYGSMTVFLCLLVIRILISRWIYFSSLLGIKLIRFFPVDFFRGDTNLMWWLSGSTNPRRLSKTFFYRYCSAIFFLQSFLWD